MLPSGSFCKVKDALRLTIMSKNVCQAPGKRDATRGPLRKGLLGERGVSATVTVGSASEGTPKPSYEATSAQKRKKKGSRKGCSGKDDRLKRVTCSAGREHRTVAWLQCRTTAGGKEKEGDRE